jgi:hypothetical protein
MEAWILIIIAGMLLAAYLLRDKARVAFSQQSKNSELVGVVLNLEQAELDKLFRLYREQFGPEAAKPKNLSQMEVGPGSPEQKNFQSLAHSPPKSDELRFEM